MERGRIFGITGNIKFTAISGDKGIFPDKAPAREAEIELFKEIPESLREKLCPLLDESRGGRGLIRIKIKIFQQFMADASAFHTETEMDHLNESDLTVTREILSGILNK